MTRRLLIVLLIPVVGLLLLLGALAAVGDRATKVEYGGRTWTGGAAQDCPLGLAATDDRVQSKQVLLGDGVLALQRADGRCNVYRPAP